MIKINELNKYYKISKGRKAEKFAALSGVSLNIDDGELVAIIGKSGAGKSTLLNIIGLLDDYDSGEYIIDGENTASLSDKESAHMRNEKIGFVLQDYALIETKTVVMNVMLPLFFNNKYSLSKMNEIAMDTLDKLGIKDQAKKRVNQLSGGQKQRVAIARAIVNDPSFILADEPTGALDTKTSGEIMELFKSLNDEGKTIIIITHDPTVADQCKRKIEISDGRIVPPPENE